MKNNQSLLYLKGYYFFYFAMVGVYVVFMPKFLHDIGYTTGEIGAIYASASMMRFLTPFVFKHCIKLTHKVFTLSLVATIITVLLFFPMLKSFEGYFVANILFGATMGISLPFMEAHALLSISKETYGKVRLWGSVGFMIIVLALAKMVNEAWQGIIALFFMALLTMYFGIKATATHRESSTALESEDSKNFSLLKHKFLWISLLLMQISFGGFYNFFTIYETANGLSLEMTSYLWSFGVLCEIAMLYFQAPLLQNNLLNLLKITTFITIFRWLILYLFPTSIAFAFLSQSLHAFSFALYHTAAISYIFQIYKQKKLAQQFYLGIAFGLGGSLGAYISGKIYGEDLFLIESFFALLAFVALLKERK